jgi:PST family polysaccharide transporter/lipopolysaccharide exporter
LKAAYLKVLELTAFVVIPLAGLIFSLCHEFVNLILDDQWLPIIPVMQILAIMGLLHAVNATRGSVYRAVGRPAINTTIKLIRLALLIVLIYPLTSKWGLVGTAWAILLITIIIQPLAWYLVIKIVKCSVWEIFRPIMFPLTATAVMAGLISLSRYVLFAEITYISFISLAIIGIAAYLMTAWVCERFFGYTVRAILCEQLSVLSKKNQS